MISYTTPINVISAQIWDIDGVASLGTEQWKITALGNNQEIIDTLLSPPGTAINSTSLDGLMDEVESMIEPDSILNDFRGKPVAFVMTC